MKKITKTRHNKYQKRKMWFWIIVGLISLLAVFIYLFYNKKSTEKRFIRVATCGCVKHEAVYSMREGSDLAMLIRMANGFKLNADVMKVNLDQIVMNDSVYHIPCKGNGSKKMRYEFIEEYNKTIKTSYRDLSKEVVALSNEKDIKCYSILYVGLPSVFVLINYYPEFRRINFVHIPHSATFLNNEYRIVDLFFTLDVYPTMRILERTLKQKIDYFLIQDRFNFIDLIDLLGGVEVNLDAPFANQYELNQGRSNIDGFYAWEYIRFLDWHNIKMTVKSEKKKDLIRQDNFEVDPSTMEMIYEMRNQRQRYVLEGMRRSFTGLNQSDQLAVIDNFKNVFRTDMDLEFLTMLYKDILSSPRFSFGTIPGQYSIEGKKMFFYPDLPNYDRLRNKEIRSYLEQRKDRKQVIY